MKVVFVGDPHGRVPDLINAIEQHHPDARAVCMVGDFDLQHPLDTYIEHLAMPVLYIPGNHDYGRVEYHDRLFRSQIAANLDGRSWQIEGLAIAGLGGHFVGKFWWPPEPPRYPSKAAYEATLNSVKRSGIPESWRNGMPLRASAAIWPEDLARLATQTADVLVTHEAPTTHRHGFAALDQLAEDLGARLIVHGHHHESYSDRINGIHVIGLAEAEIRAVEL